MKTSSQKKVKNQMTRSDAQHFLDIVRAHNNFLKAVDNARKHGLDVILSNEGSRVFVSRSVGKII